MTEASRAATGSRFGADTSRYRVMVVDDSAVIRGLLTRILEADPDIRVVASVGDGQMAVNAVQRTPVDVIVLDVEMPVMDGLTAIPKLLAAAPAARIVMASTLTRRNADISLRALQAGASDYIPKPSSTRDLISRETFSRDLLTKVKTLAREACKSTGRPAAEDVRRDTGRSTAQGAGASSLGRSDRPASPLLPVRPAAKPVLRAAPPPNRPPSLIAIGSSTGGPQALFQVLGNLADRTMPPILITQHMPATFTTILAEHITRQTGIPCREASTGDRPSAGAALLAPGGFHMVVERQAGSPQIRLTTDEPENFCRPSVDPMLRSIATCYGRDVLAVILTGMGQDGLQGCKAVVAAGGLVIAQDEATSIVWGMPGAVAGAGLCSAVLPLREIGPYVRKLAVRTAA